MRYIVKELGTHAPTNQIGDAVGTSMSKAEHIVLASRVGRFDGSVTENSASARLDQTLDGDVLDSGVGEQSIGRVVVKFSGNRTAVVHFSLRVDGEKVTAKVVAGRKHGETIKTVNVPVWARTHLAGKA